MVTDPTEIPMPPAPAQVVRGIVWAVVATIAFAFMPAIVRLLSSEMSSVEIIFHRSVISAAAIGLYFVWRGIGQLRTTALGLHLGRSTVNFIGMALWFQALAVMPLAEAVSVHFTLPLYAAIFAAIFLGERVGWRRWTATIVGFAGVLIILRPGIEKVEMPALLVLASAAFYAGAVILIKVLTRHDGALAIGFYSNLLTALLAAIPAIFLWRGPDLADVPLLIGLAATGIAAPYCVTRALALLDASLVAPIDFLRMPFTALIAWLAFAELPDLWTWIGAAVIFGSATYIARREAVVAARSRAAAGAQR